MNAKSNSQNLTTRHNHNTHNKERIDISKHSRTGDSLQVNSVLFLNKLLLLARTIALFKFEIILFGWLAENP